MKSYLKSCWKIASFLLIFIVLWLGFSVIGAVSHSYFGAWYYGVIACFVAAIPVGALIATLGPTYANWLFD